MKRSDLKSGMLIVTKTGEIGLVMLGTPNGDIIAGNGNDTTSDGPQIWFPLKHIGENLSDGESEGYDVVKVYGYPSNMEAASLETEHRELIWEKQELVTIKLTPDYNAIVDHSTSTVKVGCQNIPFDKVRELAKLIKD
jgi:hypothetical protein